MILDIYKDSFEYSVRDVNKLLKLGLLSFFSFLIVPLFLFLGYQYRVVTVAVNGMINGDDKLPEFDKYSSMFVDGVKVFLVGLVYLAVPLIIGLAVIFLGMYFNNVGLTVLGIILAIVLVIIGFLASFIAVPNMVANNGSLKKAFSFRELIDIIQSIGVLNYVGFYIGILVIDIVILAIFTCVVMFISMIFGVTLSFVYMDGISIMFLILNIIFNLIMSFLIVPFIGLFQTRSIGLIYNIRE